VLTVNRIAEPLSSVTVALVTGTPGPDVTHIRIGREAGATKYDESFVNCTDLHSIAKPSLRRRLGRLAPAEMRSVESAVRVTLGL
jgi:mRNA interferase MazF